MIRLTDVEKSFDTKPSPTYVLRRINLTIQPGEFVTIMGPSGAGKSTLLAILGMLDGEYRGQYEFRGHQVQPLKPKQRAELAKQSVGFVFQQYHLLDDLTVAENLDMPLSYRDLRGDRNVLPWWPMRWIVFISSGKKTSIPASFPAASSN